jgi:2,3-bisphosphoglycerate-independent phosphoglycerate mutase
MMDKKLILMILDGWGIGNRTKSDAIFTAGTPNIDKLTQQYPHSQLLTSGENVGLPDGQMGNSEVGHLNIGAGRVIYQDLVRINRAIRKGSFFENPALVSAFKYAKENVKNVHFLGLVSNGGVHSLDTHLYALCDMAKEFGLENVFIHAFTDGRDTDPHSGLGFLNNLQEHLRNSAGRIATITGRYYSMDRDKRWARIKTGYDAIVHGIGNHTKDPLKGIEDSYSEGVTDEFIQPIICTDDNDQPLAVIQPGDVVICFNFRTDRLREMTIALSQKDVVDFGMTKIPLYFVTMTRYDESFQDIHIAYEKDNVINTLGEVISYAGKKQLRAAETEKYAHVTFFFSGGREKVFEGENRILIPSPKVATYDMKPEMSAFKVKDEVIKELVKQKFDFVCMNLANGDMVGHTGIYEAIEEAVRTVDECVGEIVTTAKANGYDVMIIADHGNADHAVNDDGTPNTAHSLNPVPCILISDDYKHLDDGILADVAPTILNIMGLTIPEQMTGKNLAN